MTDDKRDGLTAELGGCNHRGRHEEACPECAELDELRAQVPYYTVTGELKGTGLKTKGWTADDWLRVLEQRDEARAENERLRAELVALAAEMDGDADARHWSEHLRALLGGDDG